MHPSETAQDTLASLGRRLRQERLKRNESQRMFASRMGVSTPTLQRMEAGDAKVQTGSWLIALEILNRVQDLDQVLKPEEDLFAKYEDEQKPARKRAYERRNGKS